MRMHAQAGGIDQNLTGPDRRCQGIRFLVDDFCTRADVTIDLRRKALSLRDRPIVQKDFSGTTTRQGHGNRAGCPTATEHRNVLSGDGDGQAPFE